MNKMSITFQPDDDNVVFDARVDDPGGSGGASPEPPLAVFTDSDTDSDSNASETIAEQQLDGFFEDENAVLEIFDELKRIAGPGLQDNFKMFIEQVGAEAVYEYAKYNPEFESEVDSILDSIHGEASLAFGGIRKAFLATLALQKSVQSSHLSTIDNSPQGQQHKGVSDYQPRLATTRPSRVPADENPEHTRLVNNNVAITPIAPVISLQDYIWETPIDNSVHQESNVLSLPAEKQEASDFIKRLNVKPGMRGFFKADIFKNMTYAGGFDAAGNPLTRMDQVNYYFDESVTFFSILPIIFEKVVAKACKIGYVKQLQMQTLSAFGGYTANEQELKQVCMLKEISKSIKNNFAARGQQDNVISWNGNIIKIALISDQPQHPPVDSGKSIPFKISYADQLQFAFFATEHNVIQAMQFIKSAQTEQFPIPVTNPAFVYERAFFDASYVVATLYQDYHRLVVGYEEFLKSGNFFVDKLPHIFDGIGDLERSLVDKVDKKYVQKFYAKRFQNTFHVMKPNQSLSNQFQVVYEYLRPLFIYDDYINSEDQLAPWDYDKWEKHSQINGDEIVVAWKTIPTTYTVRKTASTLKGSPALDRPNSPVQRESSPALATLDSPVHVVEETTPAVYSGGQVDPGQETTVAVYSGGQVEIDKETFVQDAAAGAAVLYQPSSPKFFVVVKSSDGTISGTTDLDTKYIQNNTLQSQNAIVNSRSETTELVHFTDALKQLKKTKAQLQSFKDKLENNGTRLGWLIVAANLLLAINMPALKECIPNAGLTGRGFRCILGKYDYGSAALFGITRLLKAYISSFGAEQPFNLRIIWGPGVLIALCAPTIYRAIIPGDCIQTTIFELITQKYRKLKLKFTIISPGSIVFYRSQRKICVVLRVIKDDATSNVTYSVVTQENKVYTAGSADLVFLGQIYNVKLNKFEQNIYDAMDNDEYADLNIDTVITNNAGLDLLIKKLKDTNPEYKISRKLMTKILFHMIVTSKNNYELLISDLLHYKTRDVLTYTRVKQFFESISQQLFKQFVNAATRFLSKDKAEQLAAQKQLNPFYKGLTTSLQLYDVITLNNWSQILQLTALFNDLKYGDYRLIYPALVEFVENNQTHTKFVNILTRKFNYETLDSREETVLIDARLLVSNAVKPVTISGSMWETSLQVWYSLNLPDPLPSSTLARK